jgi:GNAT superfamily N-acetyltransferase
VAAAGRQGDFMDDARPIVRPFVTADQVAARALILAGLGDHFGWIDQTANPDLDDIMTHYLLPGHLFVVAKQRGEIVGTGALVTESEMVGRLVRMSVDSSRRRLGIGSSLVGYLLEEARRRCFRRVLVETNNDWSDAIHLYLARGFTHDHEADGEVHLSMDLP